jgi:hypothetical protein
LFASVLPGLLLFLDCFVLKTSFAPLTQKKCQVIVEDPKNITLVPSRKIK